MAMQRVVWTVVGRHKPLRSDAVSFIGLHLTYPDRECDLQIVPSQPLVGEIPETKAVLEEFRRLRNALDHILSVEKS